MCFDKKQFLINENYQGMRLDQALVKMYEPEISRSYIQKLIKEGYVLVNGKPAKASLSLETGEIIELILPEVKKIEPLPEDINLDIVFEDEDLIILNKQAGMVVHPAAGNYEGTLVNALLFHCPFLPGINGFMRPGIVHRLDKDTSGIMMVAKTEEAMRNLSLQIKERIVKREYIALVCGYLKSEQGVIEAPIGRSLNDRKKMAVLEKGGKFAKTEFQILERFKNYTLLECRLHTGRTHQIRVHMAYSGHPLLGDKTYGSLKNEFTFSRQALHAYKLFFYHPKTKKEMFFQIPLAYDLQKLIAKLKNKDV